MDTRRWLTLFLSLFFAVCVQAQVEVAVKTFEELTMDLSGRRYVVRDLNQVPCALIKVQYAKEGATFSGDVLGTPELKQGAYWVYVLNGAKRINVHLPETPTIVVEFGQYGVSKVESLRTYSLEFRFSKTNLPVEFYAEAGFVAGSTMGPELAFGTYLSGFNIELNAMLPMTSAQSGWWQSETQPPLEFEYKPSMALGFRLGYGIQVGEKLRITPQLGMMLMTFSESAVSTTTLTPAKGANCASATLGVKLQYLLGQHFGISLTPQYSVPVAKSKGFQSLADGCEAISKWNNGVSARLAVNVAF